jgi:formylglycine-generating enzyme required for sulfatase activity
MKSRLPLLLLACLLSPAGVSSLAGQPAAPPKRVALVALAYDNRNPKLAREGVRGFGGCDRRLARELTRHGWDARLWASSPRPQLPPPADEAPTEANLRRYLKGLASLRPADEVVVVLIGHLISLEGGGPAKGGGARLYFCPEDAHYQKLARAAEVQAGHRLLGVEEVYDYLKACPARQKLLVLVAATSTTLGKPAKYPPPLCARLPKLPPPPAGLTVLTSCAEGEFTSDRADFVDKLQEGLAGLKADGAPDGKHKDGAVTAEELIAYAREAVEETGERRRFPQHPTVLGRLPRDWVLAGTAVASRWKLPTVPFPAKQAQARQAEVAKLLKLEGPVLSNGLGMKLAVIPPGEFRLGSDGGYDDERPRPRVRLPRPFFLGQHEVTQAQYQRLMGDNPSFFRTVPGQDTAAFPVEQVTFKQAVLFCNALSEKEKLTPYYRLFEPRKDRTGRVVDFRDYAPAGGPGYRLPTEAEWEWACRAGTETAFAFGNEASGKQANVDAGRPGGVKDGAYLGRPARVGSYAANAWGLYDMHGNVAERVEESYDPRRYKELAAAVTDGSGGVGYGGLVRGGAWNFPPQDCRSAVRLALPPDTAPKFVGLRVARDAE